MCEVVSEVFKMSEYRKYKILFVSEKSTILFVFKNRDTSYLAHEFNLGDDSY